MVKYGYARVSTVEQNLDRQIEALKEQDCQEIFSDKLTGATTERPELNRLLNLLKEGDIIIITDLTRFTRSTRDLFFLVDIIKQKGAFLKSIKDTWLDLSSDNPYSAFLITVMSAVSQLERDLLKMRQAEGIVIAKKKGIYKGRPKTYTERNPRLEHALELIETGNKTIKEVARITSISESTLYRAMRKNREN